MNRVIKKLEINNIHNQRIMGKGITVAVLDSGISKHLDFDNRIIYFKDFVNKRHVVYDDEGHGTMCQELLPAPVECQREK